MNNKIKFDGLIVEDGSKPQAPRQSERIAVYVGDWAGAGWWSSEPHWCDWAGSRLHSSGWCWDHLSWPQSQGSPVLHTQTWTFMRSTYTFMDWYVTVHWSVCKPTKFTDNGEAGTNHTVPLLRPIVTHSYEGVCDWAWEEQGVHSDHLENHCKDSYTDTSIMTKRTLNIVKEIGTLWEHNGLLSAEFILFECNMQ